MLWRGRKITTTDDRDVLDRLFAKVSGKNGSVSNKETEDVVYSGFLRQKLLEGAAFHTVAATKCKKTDPEKHSIHCGILSLYALAGLKLDFTKAQSLVKPDEDLSKKFHPSDTFVLSLRD
jgi:hypothetical protein